MNSTHLNEHDANQGAQSAGEFLGMAGNSGWYLLGSGGATVLMVIFLWGIFGVSLLLCLFVGTLLCLGSVAYVFTLKNGKPEHYDSDYFEAALVEAGMMSFRFGPRSHPPVNPFTAGSGAEPTLGSFQKVTPIGPLAASNERQRGSAGIEQAAPTSGENGDTAKCARAKPEPVVTRAIYEELQEKLTTTEEMLEDALVEATED